MQEAPNNKMQKVDKTKIIGEEEKEVSTLQKFFFPDYGVTIEAHSMSEARRILEQKKLNKINNK